MIPRLAPRAIGGAPTTLAIVACAVASLAGCRWLRAHHERPAPATLVAPRAAVAPVLDGELTEDVWRDAPRTPRFLDAETGVDGPPHSEARAAWDDTALYVGLYAADIDLEPTDRLGVVVGGAHPFVLDVDPRGSVRWHAPGAADVPPPPGVVVAVDADGTIADPADDDEELVVEARIPWSALGRRAAPTTLRLNFFRRDVDRSGHPRALAWVPWRTRPVDAQQVLGALRLQAAR